MASLSEKQREELHKALLEYLRGQGLAGTVQAFQNETGLTPEVLEPKFAGLLEKKWTSVVRLQKKVMDLEGMLGQAKEEAAVPLKLRAAGKDSATWIPRPPARHSLTGHRLPVNAVIFHPVFSVIVTASEDATIKVCRLLAFLCLAYFTFKLVMIIILPLVRPRYRHPSRVPIFATDLGL